MDPTIIIGGIVAVFGPSGLVWVALRFNREDSKSAVGTMREVSEELRLELERAHTQRERDQVARQALETALELAYEERGRLEHEVHELSAKCDELSAECANLRREVTLLRESNEAAR